MPAYFIATLCWKHLFSTPTLSLRKTRGGMVKVTLVSTVCAIYAQFFENPKQIPLFLDSTIDVTREKIRGDGRHETMYSRNQGLRDNSSGCAPLFVHFPHFYTFQHSIKP